MPIGDTIFSRLREATASERDAISAVLGLKPTGDAGVDVTNISAELRSTGGNTFANLFRDPHELAYRDILVDVMPEAASAAGWTCAAPPSTASDTQIEEYIWLANLCAEYRKREPVPTDEVARMQQAAEAVLEGRTTPADATNAYVQLGILGAGAAAVAAGIAAAPFGLLYAVFRASQPTTRKTNQCASILIQVRKRLESEARLRSEGDAE